MIGKCWLYVALLAMPSDTDALRGSHVTQPGKYRRFEDYRDLPIKYLQHMRPDRDHRTTPSLRIQTRKHA